MRFKVRRRDLSVWHRWFAWHPVCTENAWVWLEYVERRVMYYTYDDFPEYREIENVF